MTNRTREIFDFAQMELEATEDLAAMIRDAWPIEREEIARVAANLTAAVAAAERKDGE